MTVAIYLIFALTYLLIASRRLSLLPIGRPAGALVGALLMVAVGALSPEESYRAIDHNTILLLFGMMMLIAHMELVGLFGWLGGRLVALAGTPWGLLWSLSLLSGTLSAFLINDTVCLFLTPVVVRACQRAKLPLGPYLIALATSANIGSAATLVGNPQNMIIGSLSGMSFGSFLAWSGPAAALGLVINVGLLWIYYGRKLPRALPAPDSVPAPLEAASLSLVLGVTALVMGGFFWGLHLGYTTLAGVALLIVTQRRDPREAFGRVDWPLLVFFCSLFIVVAGLAQTGVVDRAWRLAAPALSLFRAEGLFTFTGLLTVGSNLVSNVPMVMLAGPYLAELASPRGWVLLGFVTTVAGNLTLIGSVANIIVAEGAREHYSLGFLEYLRFGIVSTLVVLAAGVALIALTV